MIKILAIETSTDACSAAILYNNNCSHRFIVAAQQHTKLILPMIQELLTETQLDLKQLDAIAFGCGPGGFTGTRLAASTIQGLALATSLPVVRISSLRALAQEVFIETGNKRVLVAQDARMQEIYWGEYQVDSNGIIQANIPDQLLAPHAIKIASTSNTDFIGVGNGWQVYADILNKHCNIPIIESKVYPQAQYIAQLASIDFARGLSVPAEEAQPVYLRKDVAWI